MSNDKNTEVFDLDKLPPPLYAPYNKRHPTPFQIWVGHHYEFSHAIYQ